MPAKPSNSYLLILKDQNGQKAHEVELPEPPPEKGTWIGFGEPEKRYQVQTPYQRLEGNQLRPVVVAMIPKEKVQGGRVQYLDR